MTETVAIARQPVATSVSRRRIVDGWLRALAKWTRPSSDDVQSELVHLQVEKERA
jgi:hypothetical protein